MRLRVKLVFFGCEDISSRTFSKANHLPISVGNRVTEKDIRDWLEGNGFVGRTAKIRELELHAIRRPGWVQVFEFDLSARLRPNESETTTTQEFDSSSDTDWIERFGVVLDDERNRTQELRTQIWLFENRSDQQNKLEEVSQGMLVRNSETNILPLLWIAITAIIFLAIVAVVSWVG